jgi:CHAD domain-containing protein
MAYRFRAKDRTVAEAVRRIAREQIDGALETIDKADAAIATHEVRKCCKKVRALVRLVRPAFPDYSGENADFRDTARLLAGSRDAKVLLDTFDLLIEGAPKGTDTGLFAPLRLQLERDREKEARGKAAAKRLDEARALLERAGERSRGWSLEDEGWEALGGGLRRIVREAREAARTVRAEPSAANYHELRKRLKYHWYHTRLLVPLWPEIMRPRSDALSRLADVLGLHHDICVFEEWLGAVLPTMDKFDAIEALLPLAGAQRKRLEGEAGPLTARLLAQRPQALADHWGALWPIWRDEAADEDD